MPPELEEISQEQLSQERLIAQEASKIEEAQSDTSSIISPEDINLNESLMTEDTKIPEESKDDSDVDLEECD